MGKDVAVKQSTEVMSLEEQLRAQAIEQQEASEAPSGNSVKATHTGFEIPGGDTVAAPLDVIILGWISQKFFYEKAYKSGEIHPPRCAAISPGTFDGMAPSKETPDPINADCDSCPYNEWGSDPVGAGKKCKDYKAIAFMLPDAKEGSEIYITRVSPTGLKEFNNYTSRLSTRYKKASIQFISQLGIKPAGASVAITVKEVEENTDINQLAYLLSRREEAMKTLLAPINFNAN